VKSHSWLVLLGFACTTTPPSNPAPESAPIAIRDSGMPATDAPKAVDAEAVPDASADASVTGVQAGFAKATIDTSRVVALAGYGTYFIGGAPHRTSSAGTHDPITVSAVAFRGADGKILVIESMDTVGLSATFVERIRDSVKRKLPTLDTSGIILSATQTHSAPDSVGLWGPLPLPGRDANFMADLERKSAEVVVAAIAALEPVSLRVGRAKLANNTLSKAPAEHEDGLVVIGAYAGNGICIGTLTQWSAHPTILGSDNNAVSADYVGAYRYFMDKELPGHVYIDDNTYLAGEADPFSSGDQDPDSLQQYRRMAEVGHTLSNTVLTALKTAQPTPTFRVAHQTWRFDMEVANARFSAAKLVNAVEANLTAPREATWFDIGGVEGVTVPGEMFSDETRKLRNFLEARGSAANLIIGIGDDWVGYLMSPRDFDDPKFEYNATLCPSRGAGEVFVEDYRVKLQGLAP
jgi:hypothetical protein